MSGECAMGRLVPVLAIVITACLGPSRQGGAGQAPTPTMDEAIIHAAASELRTGSRLLTLFEVVESAAQLDESSNTPFDIMFGCGDWSFSIWSQETDSYVLVTRNCPKPGSIEIDRQDQSRAKIKEFLSETDFAECDVGRVEVGGRAGLTVFLDPTGRVESVLLDSDRK